MTLIKMGCLVNLKSICHYSFTGMLNNSIDYSGGSMVGVDAERTRELISIRVFDDGEGIFNHIVRILNLSDQRKSLRELRKEKLMTSSGNHSGQGISYDNDNYVDTRFDVYCAQ